MLEGYADEAGLKDPTGGAHKQLVRFPKEFSFIEDANAAIEVTNRLVDAVRRPAAQVVEVDQSRCELIDYGAETLTTAIALEASRAFDLGFKGKFPEELELKKIIMAAGMPRYLGVQLPDVPDIATFSMKRGQKRSEKAQFSSPRDKTASSLTEYVQVCLSGYGYGLTPIGLYELSSLISEVIGNAEDHSGTKNWWVSGYLQQGEEYGDCHLTIFNFGKPLAESLKQLPDGAQLRQNIEKLVENHESRGLFGIGGWEPDRLWALYALQQGVSRLNDDVHIVGDRGQGTVELIRFFQNLGDTEAAVSPRMTVVSGGTQFRFDGTYRMEAKATKSGKERAIIAFNRDNDITQPPDPDYVCKLDEFFPGTLMSLRFYFDADYLETIKTESNG